MSYPEHLEPLPTVINDRRTYMCMVQSYMTADEFDHLCIALMMELNLTDKFYQLVFHLTKDILYYMEGRKQFEKSLIQEMLRWNDVAHQTYLRQRAKTIQDNFPSLS